MAHRKPNSAWFALGIGAIVALGLQPWWHQPALADAVGAELIILTLHVQNQRDALPSEYKRKLDKKGQYVLTPGIEVYYDNRLDEPLWNAREIRTTVALLEDSVAHLFAYIAVMGRWMLYEGDPWDISLTFGPGFIVRESWRDVPGYDPDNPLEESDTFLPGYEYKFLVLGEIDLLYRFDRDLQGVWSIFPGYPYVIVQSLGLRWSL